MVLLILEDIEQDFVELLGGINIPRFRYGYSVLLAYKV
jgi:hypothetical protein